MSAAEQHGPVTTTEYFGGCPECGQSDGYVNVGRDHWCACNTHKTRWYVGSNLFSSWQHESKEEQQAVLDRMGFSEYREVEPIRPAPFNPAPLLDRYLGDENAIRRLITLGYNNCGTRFTCAVCGRVDEQQIGLEFRTIDGDPVLRDCGRKYADVDLVRIYDYFWREMDGELPYRAADGELPF